MCAHVDLYHCVLNLLRRRVPVLFSSLLFFFFFSVALHIVELKTLHFLFPVPIHPRDVAHCKRTVV
jgi:hypothetical protein